jgi:hypothetical protein
MVTTEGELGVYRNVKRKAKQADKMFEMLIKHMNNELSIKTKENFNNYYPYQEQISAPQNQMRVQQTYQYSFWDRMVMSRREVMKLFILSLVIILGISLEKIGCHYINQYLSSNDLTYIQELLVRFSFPIIIFIILWIIKSL